MCHIVIATYVLEGAAHVLRAAPRPQCLAQPSCWNDSCADPLRLHDIFLMKRTLIFMRASSLAEYAPTCHNPRRQSLVSEAQLSHNTVSPTCFVSRYLFNLSLLPLLFDTASVLERSLAEQRARADLLQEEITATRNAILKKSHSRYSFPRKTPSDCAL